jgi:HSF-type DNA-binding
VLPHFFQGQNEFGSFQRQLNLYGFLRMTAQGPDQHAYYHEYFLRNRPHLCVLITRSRIAAHSKRRSYDSTSEPDFHKMPRLNGATRPRHVPSIHPSMHLNSVGGFLINTTHAVLLSSYCAATQLRTMNSLRQQRFRTFPFRHRHRLRKPLPVTLHVYSPVTRLADTPVRPRFICNRQSTASILCSPGRIDLSSKGEYHLPLTYHILLFTYHMTLFGPLHITSWDSCRAWRLSKTPRTTFHTITLAASRQRCRVQTEKQRSRQHSPMLHLFLRCLWPMLHQTYGQYHCRPPQIQAVVKHVARVRIDSPSLRVLPWLNICAA